MRNLKKKKRERKERKEEEGGVLVSISLSLSLRPSWNRADGHVAVTNATGHDIGSIDHVNMQSECTVGYSRGSNRGH